MSSAAARSNVAKLRKLSDADYFPVVVDPIRFPVRPAERGQVNKLVAIPLRTDGAFDPLQLRWPVLNPSLAVGYVFGVCPTMLTSFVYFRQ